MGGGKSFLRRDLHRRVGAIVWIECVEVMSYANYYELSSTPGMLAKRSWGNTCWFPIFDSRVNLSRANFLKKFADHIPNKASMYYFSGEVLHLNWFRCSDQMLLTRFDPNFPEMAEEGNFGSDYNRLGLDARDLYNPDPAMDLDEE